MYGRPVQLYVSILILETVSPILHEMSHSLMVCRSVSMVCFFCSLMFRFTACISSSVVVDSCQPLFTIIFLDLLLVLEVSGCFSYNGMGFRLQLPFRIFLCGYSKLFSINRTFYNNISFTHLLRYSLGDILYLSLNVRLNVLWLSNPLSRQIFVIDSLVFSRR